MSKDSHLIANQIALNKNSQAEEDDDLVQIEPIKNVMMQSGSVHVSSSNHGDDPNEPEKTAIASMQNDGEAQPNYQ